MTDEIFLFDTYALIEVLNKNINYENYLDKGIVINEFIYAEFCYKLLLEDVPGAKDYSDWISEAVVVPDLDVIEKAMAFKKKHKKRKVSMTDCISYIQASEIGIKFLTGDKEFEDLENVEFVK